MVYPITNRATTLTIDYFYLRRYVGRELGIGFSDADRDDEQAQVVDDLIDTGLRLYYYPPPLPASRRGGTPYAHTWSFLRPTHTFKTSADQRFYELPDNFESPAGRIAFVDNSNDFYPPLFWTSPEKLRQIRHRTDWTSFPQFAAICPQFSAGDRKQRLLLELSPTPDSGTNDEGYLLSYQYNATANRIRADNPFPLGGQMHGQGILYACLAAAELHRTGQRGARWEQFMKALAANIERDAQRLGDTLGYNSDRAPGHPARVRLRNLEGFWSEDISSATSYG